MVRQANLDDCESLGGAYFSTTFRGSVPANRFGDLLASHRLDEAMLANDRADQVARGHVEGGIIDFDTCGGRLPAKAAGYFFGSTLFDRNFLTGFKRQIERARGSGDVDGNAMGGRQQG